MKLLICTQAMDANDSNLGFFVQWIEEFAKHCERVEVVCLREGVHHLPANVRIHTLSVPPSTGMIYHTSAATRLVRAIRFKRLAWRLRHEYDAVFVHMNPEYLVIAGPLWRVLGKPSALWYAHQSVTRKLRIATFFANYIFTVSPESFGIETPKKHAVGHGIDTALFVPRARNERASLDLVTIGRLSPRKHLLELFPVLDLLHAEGVAFTLTIVGAPLTAEDVAYAARLAAEAKGRPYHEFVRFLGALAHQALPHILAESDVALNLSATGNMDKAGLEALLMGVPLVTTNEAFRALPALPGLSIVAPTPRALADAVLAARLTDVSALAAVIRREHSLETLIPKILAVLGQHD